ncbi:hypothetical protein BDQ12DRAFT_688024 [Crucibulum laeve]|uniref:Post-SET domain-containing protein n=1 Tax=Crucibulum laeve TaxID=68775 RepID=A0A5C3LS43_9AGAR|nr:hypothetical protein BDQ12DRAFT_688024 [Crucibulum laeve]
MDNSLSGVSDQPNNQPFSVEPSLSISVDVGQADQQTNAAPVDGPSVAPQTPAKRRPGRPKGSTKKNLLGGAPEPPKVKRPVGRPRKDGLPAGSTGPTRSRPKRDKTISNGLAGVSYPPLHSFHASISAPLPSAFQIDPNLERDDWAQLSRTNPNAFLSTLLAALAAPNPVSSAGPSVEEAFKSHLVSLAPNPIQTQPIPSLYSILKTFWLPSSPAYFSLTASASTARTPSEHRFLYWDPQPLVFNGISCPSCSSPLNNKGRISSGPIKIYDIEKPFFIIGCEYICTSPQCLSTNSPDGRKFASTDSSILRSLPAKLQDEFPARLLHSDTDAGSGSNIWNWKALGVSLSLWNMVLGAIRLGIKKEVILHLIYSIQVGVPEDDGLKQEEEEADEDELDEDQVMESVQPAAVDTSPPFTDAPDAYTDAWKENTAVADNSNEIIAPTPQAPATAGSSTQTSAPPSQAYPPGYAPYPYGPYAFFPTGTVMVSSSPPQNIASNIAPVPISSPSTSKSNGSGASDPEALDKKRSPRHCCKCGSQECKGKGGRDFCQNPCQDCGKFDCRGRNSRRPDKKCTEGWS